MHWSPRELCPSDLTAQGVSGQQGVSCVPCCSPEEQVLPMLRFVQTRGNATVYEWRTGTQPSVVERPRLEEPPEQVEEDAVSQAEGELSPHSLDSESQRKKGVCARDSRWEGPGALLP